MFNLWNLRKNSSVLKGLSNRQFAEILLHERIDDLRARCSVREPTDAEEIVSTKLQTKFTLHKVVCALSV